MKTFMGFIVSIAVVCFCFFYYLQNDSGRRKEEPELSAVAGSVRANMALAAAPAGSSRTSPATSSVTLIAERGKWKADTVRYMRGGDFFQQVLVKFSAGVLIEHTDGSADNQFFLLNRRDFVTHPGQDRMLFVLDSLGGRLAWREIIRDGKPMKAALDTLRVQFLLLRRPQS